MNKWSMKTEKPGSHTSFYF